MVKVKICGITNKEDAFKAVSLGAWALGFVFYEKSPRYVSPSKVRAIVKELPPFITPIGVFVNQRQGTIEKIAEFCRIKTLQFHGDELPNFCHRFRKYKIIKAFRINENFDFRRISKYQVNGYLFDAYQEDQFGGTGKTFRWELLRGITQSYRTIILSGGLTPRNIAYAIRKVTPYAVDVSSGVEESPGKKSERLLKQFFKVVNGL